MFSPPMYVRKESQMITSETKRELIQAILNHNRSAAVTFLEKFEEQELRAYLNRLSEYKPICYLKQAVLPRHAERHAWY
jgi:hypothetical protein